MAPKVDNSGLNLSFWHRLLKEPLLHFLILGGLVFGVDARITALHGDSTIIKVGKAEQMTLMALFRAGRGREPSPDEMNGLIARWVDGEILYREGLSLGLDRGDPGIRERVISNAIGMIRSSAAVSQPDDVDIRPWIEAHRTHYRVVIEGQLP